MNKNFGYGAKHHLIFSEQANLKQNLAIGLKITIDFILQPFCSIQLQTREDGPHPSRYKVPFLV